MRKLFYKTFCLLALVGIMIPLFGLSQIQAQGQGSTPGRPYIELRKSGSFVANNFTTGVVSIPRNQVQQYSLFMSISPVDGQSSQNWRGNILISKPDNTTQTLSLFNPERVTRYTEKTHQFQANTAAAGEYTYQLIFTPDNVNNTTVQLKVRFTDGSDTTTPPTNSSPTNTQTNSPTNSTVKGSAGGSVDTNVNASWDMSLDDPIGSFFNPLSGHVSSAPQLITALIRILFALIGIVAVVVIIVAGFRMVTSSGSEEQITKAKKAITWAIIGLVVSLLSFSIVAIIQRLIQVGA